MLCEVGIPQREVGDNSAYYLVSERSQFASVQQRGCEHQRIEGSNLSLPPMYREANIARYRRVKRGIPVKRNAEQRDEQWLRPTKRFVLSYEGLPGLPRDAVTLLQPKISARRKSGHQSMI